MKPRLLRAGYFWRSNDPADIIVGESHFNEAVCIAPTLISVVDVNCLVHHEISISLSRLEFLVAGLFGPSRPFGLEVWNGGGHRYGVYIYTDSLDGENIVILSNTLDGTRGVILPYTSTEAWKTVFYGLPSKQVWDICWTLKRIHDSKSSQEQEVLTRD